MPTHDRGMATARVVLVTLVTTNSPRRSAGRALFAASFVLVGLVIAAGLLLVATLLDLLPGRTETVDRSAPVVLGQLQDLARFKAASGEFSQVVDLEKDVKGIPSFLAGERTMLIAVGSVDAEVDFAQLDHGAIVVSPDGTRAEIRLPAAVLTPPRIDHERTHVAARQRGVLNRVNDALGSDPGDDSELLRLAEDRITEAAAATELRERAEENTRAMLTTLLTGLGFTEVVVTFDAPLT